MTEVEVQFHGSRHHQFQHLINPFDTMPDAEDEVRNIVDPLMAGPRPNDVAVFLSTEDEIVRRQERGCLVDGLFDDIKPGISDVEVAFYAKDGVPDENGSFAREEAKLGQSVVRVQSDSVAVTYEVHGLLPHEMPVIGMHIDDRIMPGFQYRVRLIGDDSTQATPRYQFRGEPLHLLRIGQGYGKRLTFAADNLNDNTNYFWSDSSPAGYGFGIVAVQTGDEMVLTDLAHRPIGRGTVEEASPCQLELSTETLNEGPSATRTLVKRVAVIMKVRLRYTCERHGIRSIRADESAIVRGVARVVKQAGESKARTRCIEQLELSNLGQCLLYLL